MRQIFLVGLLGCAAMVDGCGSSAETSSAATGAGGSGSGSSSSSSSSSGGAAGTTSGTTGGGDATSSSGQGGGLSACPAVTAFQVEIHRNNEPLYKDCSLPSEWTTPDLVAH